MKIFTSYRKKIKHYNHIFKDTLRVYRAAVDFFISVCLNEWDQISFYKSANSKMTCVERLTHSTKKRPVVKYEFSHASTRFYKFPSYLRRAAINEAVGKVSSYRSNLKNWEEDPTGQKPGLPKAGFVFPCMYKGNMYQETSAYQARIKVFIRNTWDWINVTFRRSDVDYILHHCQERKECIPVLMRKGKEWYLSFSYEEQIALTSVPVKEQRILAVDLGINNACVCSAMSADGTVLGRRFLSLPRENDCLQHKVNHIRRAQCHGAVRTGKLWSYANGVNRQIAIKTARFILETATIHHVHVIVFEHLNLGRKKRGSKRQRLHLWKARSVQSIVMNQAHREGIRVSSVCAWNSSRLAYDGTGRVERMVGGNYSVCRFPSGKIYHCDLNASYNIGARYFIREHLKSVPATEWQRIQAKVPEFAKRSTCTLSTLISLYAGLYAECA